MLETITAMLVLACPALRTEPTRVDTIAYSIASAAEGDAVVARLLVTVGRFESNFVERIQLGRCQPWECDRGRARSYWQLQRTSYVRDLWSDLVGVDPSAAALGASRVLRRGLKACGGSERGALSFYATGHCGWRKAGPRAAYADWLARRVR